MLKKTLLILACFNLLMLNLSASDRLIVELNFPKPGYPKAAKPKALLAPVEVSGNLIIDITPYPANAEQDRYLVEYFLDDQLISQSSGVKENNPQRLSFTYILDTTKFANGPHKIIINLWDKSGPSAIGIRKIIINNE